MNVPNAAEPCGQDGKLCCVGVAMHAQGGKAPKRGPRDRPRIRAPRARTGRPDTGGPPYAHGATAAPVGFRGDVTDTCVVSGSADRREQGVARSF